MISREERMATNEASSREINERIEEAYHGEPPANRIDIVCECARMTCDAAIDITLDEYRHVRMDPRQFAVVPEHFIGDIDRIVYENDRFAVVAKREGMPADVARDENPRV
jgi:23S rRNA-/tRNA-specific pseudouridylate synthase